MDRVSGKDFAMGKRFLKVLRFLKFLRGWCGAQLVKRRGFLEIAINPRTLQKLEWSPALFLYHIQKQKSFSGNRYTNTKPPEQVSLPRRSAITDTMVHVVISTSFRQFHRSFRLCIKTTTLCIEVSMVHFIQQPVASSQQPVASSQGLGIRETRNRKP